MQYQPFELTPRGVLSGFKVKPAATPDLTVLIEPGVFCLGMPKFFEVKTTTTLNLTASKPGSGSAVVPLYANVKADGTVEITLTKEADTTPGYNRFGAVDNAEDHTKGRSIKIAEVTVASDATALGEAQISMLVRHQFDGQRTNFNGLHNANPNNNW